MLARHRWENCAEKTDIRRNFVCIAGINARAELVIDVQGVAQPTPVAIVPFGWQGTTPAVPLDVAEVIDNDLRRSGRFAPISEDDMLQKPTSGEDVDFDDWSYVGVEAVVVGSVEQESENVYNLQFQLFDVFGRRQTRRLPHAGQPRHHARGGASCCRHDLREADRHQRRLRYQGGLRDGQQQGQGRLYSLIVSDQDGDNEYTIMESKDPIMSPAWSPDSRQLAYVSFEGNKSSIFVQTLRTGNRFQVSSKPGINGAPSFSPDGRKLVVTLGGVDGNLDIYMLDINSRQAQRLTTHRAIDTEGSWSPDGRYIYFTSDRAGGPQVYRVAATGGSPERITFEGSYNARPRLSPDGKRLAVVHNDQGNFRIAVMDIDSKNLLVVSKGRQDESPSFAPNSDSLIYATRQGQNGVLETVSADGLIRQKMASGQGDVREPVWSPFPKF